MLFVDVLDEEVSSYFYIQTFTPEEEIRFPHKGNMRLASVRIVRSSELSVSFVSFYSTKCSKS